MNSNSVSKSYLYLVRTGACDWQKPVDICSAAFQYLSWMHYITRDNSDRLKVKSILHNCFQMRLNFMASLCRTKLYTVHLECHLYYIMDVSSDSQWIFVTVGLSTLSEISLIKKCLNTTDWLTEALDRIFFSASHYFPFRKSSISR